MEADIYQLIHAAGSVATMAIAFMFWRVEKRLTILEIKHDTVHERLKNDTR